MKGANTQTMSSIESKIEPLRAQLRMYGNVLLHYFKVLFAVLIVVYLVFKVYKRIKFCHASCLCVH